ncbi:MAG: serine hydrolase domain-containing protein, partial [Acidobacteriota bacterium]
GGQPCKDGKREVGLAEDEGNITMRQLLGHLGGIMHYSNGRGSPVPPQSKANHPETNQGFAWALDYFTSKPLVARPGTAHRYTTFGFNLAGAVIEKAGKRPFAQQLQERIAGPLGLKSLQPDYEWAEIPDRAVGYRLRGIFNNRQGSDDVSWKLPGGGVLSTVEDLTNYCKGLVGDGFLSQQEKELLWTSQTTADGKQTGYGMGFGVEDGAGQKRVTHGGSQQKAKTYLLAVPAQKSCVTVMSNSVQANPRKIAVGLLDLLEKR